MHLAALPLLIAQGEGFGDFPWLIVIVAIASALGGLLKKKEPKTPPRHRGGRRAPQVEHPPVPIPPSPDRPAPRTSPTPQRRREEVDRRPPIIQTEEYGPTGRRRGARPVPQARPSAPPNELPAGPPTAPTMPVRQAVAPPALATTAASRGDVRLRVERLLSVRRDVQAGFVLAEILAPPLALRDQHSDTPW